MPALPEALNVVVVVHTPEHVLRGVNAVHLEKATESQKSGDTMEVGSAEAKVVAPL